ncbi:hypothetical protein EVG20_g3244 [Dentipellis fragilis]|uniref:Uncharacterized protein n=1 Tax=Dentipellis fragilis TaxID=205917 RepID=A0A4Y9Z5Q0_9AGAM|nr:hypothetical protein EVG20_g3244 [Dentipellis fragilis]
MSQDLSSSPPTLYCLRASSYLYLPTSDVAALAFSLVPSTTYLRVYSIGPASSTISRVGTAQRCLYSDHPDKRHNLTIQNAYDHGFNSLLLHKAACKTAGAPASTGTPPKVSNFAANSPRRERDNRALRHLSHVRPLPHNASAPQTPVETTAHGARHTVLRSANCKRPPAAHTYALRVGTPRGSQFKPAAFSKIRKDLAYSGVLLQSCQKSNSKHGLFCKIRVNSGSSHACYRGRKVRRQAGGHLHLHDSAHTELLTYSPTHARGQTPTCPPSPTCPCPAQPQTRLAVSDRDRHRALALPQCGPVGWKSGKTGCHGLGKFLRPSADRACFRALCHRRGGARRNELAPRIAMFPARARAMMHFPTLEIGEEICYQTSYAGGGCTCGVCVVARSSADASWRGFHVEEAANHIAMPAYAYPREVQVRCRRPKIICPDETDALASQVRSGQVRSCVVEERRVRTGRSKVFDCGPLICTLHAI